jgi:REP element-mobilizing transposase RayT
LHCQRTMAFYHFVSRARWSLRPLTDRDRCADLWRRLQSKFEVVLAAVLMPEHLHLLIESPDVERAHLKLRKTLAAFTRVHYPGSRLWDPTPTPEPVPDLKHLQRTIRYIHLNPCRRGLATDPLQWEWSTHRDAVGATSKSWVDLPRLRTLQRVPAGSFAPEFHRYVSSDPTVRMEGTELPQRLSVFHCTGVLSLEQLANAVLQSAHAPNGAYSSCGSERRVVLHLADQLGANPRKALAEFVGLQERAVRAILSQPLNSSEMQVLEAARWILSDVRRFRPEPARGRNGV